MKHTGIVLNLGTENLNATKIFYRDLLGFMDLLEKKADNNNYIILYNPKLSQHLFLKISLIQNEKYVKPTEDHLLVFYLNNDDLYEQIVSKLTTSNTKSVNSYNPYWERVGRTFLAPDDYRIVFCPGNYKNNKSRIARPTSNISDITNFYTKHLNLKCIDQFSNHEGFDGSMLGSSDLDCHLEMTYQYGNTDNTHPSGYKLEFITDTPDSELLDSDQYQINIISQDRLVNTYIAENIKNGLINEANRFRL